MIRMPTVLTLMAATTVPVTMATQETDSPAVSVLAMHVTHMYYSILLIEESSMPMALRIASVLSKFRTCNIYVHMCVLSMFSTFVCA